MHLGISYEMESEEDSSLARDRTGVARAAEWGIYQDGPPWNLLRPPGSYHCLIPATNFQIGRAPTDQIAGFYFSKAAKQKKGTVDREARREENREKFWKEQPSAVGMLYHATEKVLTQTVMSR